MNRVKAIFRKTGGDREIVIRIGNVDLLIEYGDYRHLINDGEKHYGTYTEVEIAISSLKKLLVLTIDQEIHDNKLEVLKSEFEYKYNNHVSK